MNNEGTSATRSPYSVIYMKYIITKTEEMNGTQIVPGSKSETIRALVFSVLSEGISEIKNFLNCDDTETALRVLKDIGVHTSRQPNKVIIKSAGLPIKTKINKINTGNSGITTRFILPMLGLRENNDLPVIFDCGEQMRMRPIISLVNALNNLGMNITFLKKHGTYPLSVKGALAGGTTSVDGTISQYLSALLLSLPLAPSDSIITVKNLHERPYVEMTLQYLDSLGVSYSHRKVKNTDIYKIKGNQKYFGFKKNISGDFSSASCLIVAGCVIKGKIVLEGLNMKSSQGDKKLIEILQKMGADIRISKTKITIIGGKKLIGVSIDANNIPDLVPALAVIATRASGKTKIYNVAQARLKETDRIRSMSLGLRRMGARVEEHKDGLTVYESVLTGSTIQGFDDHRTVMAFVIAGMIADGKTTVNDAEAVNKTFPNFYQLIKALGANIKLEK